MVRIIMDLTETDLRMTYAYVCIVADANWYFVGSIFNYLRKVKVRYCNHKTAC